MISTLRSDTQRMLDIVEQKLQLGTNELIKLDLRDIGLEIVEECVRAINIPRIDEKVSRFGEIDIEALEKACHLLQRDDIKNRSIVLPSREVKAAEELQKYDDHLKIMKEQSKELSRLEVGLRLGMALDAHLRNVLMCLEGDQEPIPELIALIETKLSAASKDEMALLWGRMKAEFQPPQFIGDGSLKVLPPILDETFFVVRDATDIPHRLAEFIVRIRPQLLGKLFAEGERSFPLLLPGPATLLAHKGNKPHEIPSTIEVAALRSVSSLLWIWEKVLGGDKSNFLRVVGLDKNTRTAKGEDYQKVDEVLSTKKGTPDEVLKLFILELKQLGSFADRFISTSTPVEQALIRFKLGREVLGAEKNEWKSKNEIRLQREMCKFLLEQGVYSFGKTFGRNEIDLMAEQPGEVFIVEAKRIKSVTPALVKTYLPQLQTYLDQEPSASRGILAIFNYGPTLIAGPRIWLSGRYWILAINLGERSASKTKTSLQVVEGKNGELIDCLVVDSERNSSRRTAAPKRRSSKNTRSKKKRS